VPQLASDDANGNHHKYCTAVHHSEDLRCVAISARTIIHRGLQELQETGEVAVYTKLNVLWTFRKSCGEKSVQPPLAVEPTTLAWSCWQTKQYARSISEPASTTEIAIFSSCDREVWPMTLTLQFTRIGSVWTSMPNIWVSANLLQKLLSADTQTDTDKHTRRTDCSTWTTKM